MTDQVATRNGKFPSNGDHTDPYNTTNYDNHSTVNDVANVDTLSSPPIIGYVRDTVGSQQGNIRGGATTDDSHPQLMGKGQPNSTVTIYDNGNPIGTALVDARGVWWFTPDTALSNGPHSLTAVADGQTSEPFAFNVDTQVPAPIIGYVYATAGNQQAYVHAGATTDDGHPRLMGKGQPNSTVTIYDNGNPIGTALVDARGIWWFAPDTALDNGPHSLTAMVDGQTSEPFVFNVDTQVPAPIIGYVYEAAGNQQAYVHAGATTDDDHPRLMGKGQPNSTVTIYDHGNPIGTTLVDARGIWWFTPDTALNNGPHSLTAMVDGQTSEPFAFNVQAPPTSDLSAKIAYAVDNSSGSDNELQSGDTTTDRTPVLHGTGEPNTTVLIWDNRQVVASVMVDEEGHWTYNPPADLMGSSHEFRVLGNHGPLSEPFDITIDPRAFPPVSIDGGHQSDGSGLLSGETTSDEHPTLTGKVDMTSPWVADQAGNVWVIILDNGKEIGRVQPEGNGFWEFRMDTALSSGEHHFTAQLGDSPASNVFDLIEVPPMTDPTLVFLGATVGDAFFRSGEWIDNVRPTLHGKNAGANAIVTILEDGHPIGTAKASASGAWSFPMENALTDGMHHYTAQVGNGPVSKPFDLGVVTPMPSIDVVYDHSGDCFYNHGDIAIADGHPTFTGKGPLGSYVTLLDNGEPIGTVQVEPNGLWSFTPELGAGPHHLTVVTDNGKTNTAVFDITIDHTTATHDAAETLSLNDVVTGSEGELFAAGHHHDQDSAQLSVRDVEAAAMDNVAAHGVNVAMHDTSSPHANLVLPHEQVHALV